MQVLDGPKTRAVGVSRPAAISEAVWRRCHEGRKILILDDHEPTLAYMRLKLSPFYPGGVHTFNDPVQALEAINDAKQAGTPYDVCSVDLYMPGKAMHGPEFIKRLYELVPTPCVINTASMMDHDALRILNESHRRFETSLDEAQLVDFEKSLSRKPEPVAYHHKCDLDNVLALIRAIDSSMINMAVAQEQALDLQNLFEELDTKIVPIVFTDDILHRLAEDFRAFGLQVSVHLGAMESGIEGVTSSRWWQTNYRNVAEIIQRFSKLHYTVLRSAPNLSSEIHELLGSIPFLAPPGVDELGIDDRDSSVASRIVADWKKAYIEFKNNSDGLFKELRKFQSGEIDLRKLVVDETKKNNLHAVECPYPALKIIDPSRLIAPIIAQASAFRFEGLYDCEVSVRCDTAPFAIGAEHAGLAISKMRQRQFGETCAIKFKYNTDGFGEPQLSPSLMNNLVEAERAGNLVWIAATSEKDRSTFTLTVYIKLGEGTGELDPQGENYGPKFVPQGSFEGLLDHQVDYVAGLGPKKNITIIGRNLGEGALASNDAGLFYVQGDQIFISLTGTGHVGTAYQLAIYFSNIGLALESRSFTFTSRDGYAGVREYLKCVGYGADVGDVEITEDSSGFRIRNKSAWVDEVISIEGDQLQHISDRFNLKARHDFYRNAEGEIIVDFQGTKYAFLQGIRLKAEANGSVCIDGSPDDGYVARVVEALRAVGFKTSQITAEESRDKKYAWYG